MALRLPNPVPQLPSSEQPEWHCAEGKPTAAQTTSRLGNCNALIWVKAYLGRER